MMKKKSNSHHTLKPKSSGGWPQRPTIKKHKITSHCFNQCVEWKLVISYSHNKTSYAISLQGKSLFFKTLEKSILNILQDKSNMFTSSTQNNSAKQRLGLSSFSDLSYSQFSKEQQDSNEIWNIKFPINNKEFNYMIIDSNLGIKENLSNIFILEFDLMANNKEQLKNFREINNDNVDRETWFILNGYLHDTPWFSSELKFSVETRKFIKSIQFKLETYKNELIQQKKLNSNFHHMINTKNNWHAKVLSNTNLGIEFTKPHFDIQQPEKLYTNFNSVVNSNISLSKIFLEVCIPKIFLNTTVTNDILKSSQNTQQCKKINDIKMDNFHFTNSMQADKTWSNNASTASNYPASKGGKDKPIKIPPLQVSDFQKLKEQKFNSPNTNDSFLRSLKHNPSNYGSHPNYLSPDYMQMTHPTIYGVNNNWSSINTTTNSSSIYFSPNYRNVHYSPNNLSYISEQKRNRNYLQAINPFIPPIKTIELNNNMPPRRLSENTYEKMREGPLSNYSVHSSRSNIQYTQYNYFNTNTNNNWSMRSYCDDYSQYSGVFGNGYVSPRVLGNFQFGLDGNGGIPTIHKKIMDWEKMNNNVINSNSNNINPDNKVDEKGRVPYLNINSNDNKNMDEFIHYYEGLCNFLIFLRTSTPCVCKSRIEQFTNINLSTFFKSFSHTSWFGLKVNYYNSSHKALIQSIYSPSLSSLEISITNTKLILEIIDNLILKKRCNKNIKQLIIDYSNNALAQDIINKYSILEYSLSEKTSCLKVIIKDWSRWSINYYENKPPHWRDIFINTITEIKGYLSSFLEINIKKLCSGSWFSILWYPVKSNNSNYIQSSFLTYYQFKFSEESFGKETKYTEVPVIGVLPIKLNHIYYWETISKSKSKGYDNNIWQSSVQNVTNMVWQNAYMNSEDVEFYYKNN